MQEINRREIKKALRNGDHLKIKAKTGKSLSYISQVINGSRDNDSILEAAAEVAAENIERRKKIAQMVPNAESI